MVFCWCVYGEFVLTFWEFVTLHHEWWGLLVDDRNLNSKSKFQICNSWEIDMFAGWSKIHGPLNMKSSLTTFVDDYLMLHSYPARKNWSDDESGCAYENKLLNWTFCYFSKSLSESEQTASSDIVLKTFPESRWKSTKSDEHFGKRKRTRNCFARRKRMWNSFPAQKITRRTTVRMFRKTLRISQSNLPSNDDVKLAKMTPHGTKPGCECQHSSREISRCLSKTCDELFEIVESISFKRWWFGITMKTETATLQVSFLWESEFLNGKWLQIRDL